MTTPATTTFDTSVAPHPRTEHILPLPHIPETVSAVRHRARTVLARWALPTETADDAILVISELITNAIAHALPPAVLRLSMPEVGGRHALRIEVTDAGPPPRPRRSPESPPLRTMTNTDAVPASWRPFPCDTAFPATSKG